MWFNIKFLFVIIYKIHRITLIPLRHQIIFSIKTSVCLRHFLARAHKISKTLFFALFCLDTEKYDKINIKKFYSAINLVSIAKHQEHCVTNKRCERFICYNFLYYFQLESLPFSSKKQSRRSLYNVCKSIKSIQKTSALSQPIFNIFTRQRIRIHKAARVIALWATDISP